MPSSGRGKNSASLDWFLSKAAPFGAAFGIRFDSHDTKKEMHPERVHLFFGSLSKNYPNAPVSAIIEETGVFTWKVGEKTHGMSQSS